MHSKSISFEKKVEFILHNFATLFALCMILVLFQFLSFNTLALLELEVSKGYSDPIPIAIDDFEGDSYSAKFANDIRNIVANDLQSSGIFRLIDKQSFIEDITFDMQPTFSNWRKVNATLFITGKVMLDQENGKVIVQFKIWDPYRETLVTNSTIKINKISWRRLGHRVADTVYEKVMGDPGYFDTRIAFIADFKNGKTRTKKLAIMDYDGANLSYLTQGREIVATPRFHPQNQKIMYISYKNKMPQVFLMDLTTGLEKHVGSFGGMSFAPRFAPDGEHALMSLSERGTTSIYEINLLTNSLRKIIYDLGAISTSPSYSPDGKQIVFNSDRSGSRQLYIINRDGTDLKRISFGPGSYAAPVWSPKGDLIAFVKIHAGSFYIGVMNTDGTNERVLTSSYLEDGATWSPNGRSVMFYRQSRQGDSKIYAVDVTGHNLREIKTPMAAISPAWSNSLH